MMLFLDLFETFFGGIFTFAVVLLFLLPIGLPILWIIGFFETLNK